MFTFNVIYTPASANKGADAISRSPVGVEESLVAANDIDEEISCIAPSIIACLDAMNNEEQDGYVSYLDMKEVSNTDELYQKLGESISKGFPSSKEGMHPDIQCFWGVKDRLILTNEGIILMDSRVVIPTAYRKFVLKLLHSAHQGVGSMK